MLNVTLSMKEDLLFRKLDDKLQNREIVTRAMQMKDELMFGKTCVPTMSIEADV